MNREEAERHRTLCDEDVPEIRAKLAALHNDIEFLMSIFLCESCDGNGEVEKDDGWEACADCGGKGWSK